MLVMYQTAMKNWIATLCLAAGAAATAPMAWAATFEIPDAGVSFKAPEGFTELTSEEIGAKYASGRAPTFVAGNAQRTTTIALELKPQALTKDKLPHVNASFETLFDRVIPRIDWKQKKLIDMQGQQWIYLEMTSRASEADIYNIMLVTPHRGRMLVLNLNSTKSDFPAVEKELRKSLETIAVAGE